MAVQPTEHGTRIIWEDPLDSPPNSAAEREAAVCKDRSHGKERKQESRDVLGLFFYNKLFLGNLIYSYETAYSQTLALMPSQGNHLPSAAPFDVMTLKTKLPAQRSWWDKPHPSMADGLSSP